MNSQSPDPSFAFSAEDFAEWNRRLAAYRADPSLGVSWEEAKRLMFGGEERRDTN